MILKFKILLLLTTFIQTSLGINCYSCISPDKLYNATLRRQFATQSDLFFYPLNPKTETCRKPIDANIPLQIEADICSKYPLCITLFPNLPKASFVIRGCFEHVMRYAFRESDKLQKPGCFLIHSVSTFHNVPPMDYIACICQGAYCNTMAIPETVPESYSFTHSNILQLNASNPEGALRVVSSSSPFSQLSIRYLCIFCTLLLHSIFQ
ncbi:unnamed protein product [Caenorhabditis bovis]|uniref:UPAR/Ly6 domain-containing protein n=1 Tax=Caenorhabditis bovis TaxID=2654633 RepID=A0A8S1EDG0_9PELO|nr:unnamed protein product [Caenorhabditis bovis]